MGMKFWSGACFMTCFCFLGSATAQDQPATRCAATTASAGEHAAQPSAESAADDHARKLACSRSEGAIRDSDKALAVALLGCVIALASHVSRRRSARVVLS